MLSPLKHLKNSAVSADQRPPVSAASTTNRAQLEEDLVQRNRERIEKLSITDRVSKVCIDAGFLTTVEAGQYFLTKTTVEFSQFTDAVACRECSLPRDESLIERKGWIRGNTKIGPVLEVTICCLPGELRC